MIQNVSFRRKVFYLCVIALLLFPLYMIGRPATGDPATDPLARPGGTLAQLRTRYDLSPAQLGEIDPASESMKLATLGMRGVAANILWTKANHYKKTQNWEAFVATVNQISKLQPHFLSVWEFQSHNLSYNISVEHDDYRFRYLWVKKGIEFLIRGTHYNRWDPLIYHSVGWFLGQKFGLADENKQFRRLFRDDHDFHVLLSEYVDLDGEGRGVDNRPDTWLASRLWYLQAYNLVDTRGASIRRKAPHIFFADGPKARMNFAATVESEGYFGEKAEYAWQKGGEEWKAYGDRPILTSWGDTIRLNDEEKLKAEAEKLVRELDHLAPGMRELLRKEKMARLTDAQRRALQKPVEEIDNQPEYDLRYMAQVATQVSDREVAERAPSANRAKAYRIADQIRQLSESAEHINTYRTTVNFNYWRARCEIEQRPEIVRARRSVFDAKRLQDQGQLEAAEKEYNKAWDLWATIMGDNPDLTAQLMADDLRDDLKRYLELLSNLEKRVPPDFKLMPVLRQYVGQYFGELPDYLKPLEKDLLPAGRPPGGEAKPPTGAPTKEAAGQEPAGQEGSKPEPPAKKLPKTDTPSKP